MKNNTQTNRPNEAAVNHAVNILNQELTNLRKEMHGKTGEERAAIEQKIQACLARLGFDQIELKTPDTADGVGAKIAAGISSVVEEAAKANAANAAAAPGEEAKVKVEAEIKTTVGEKPSLWARFKAWVSENKTKAVVGSLSILAGAAGLWYWISGKNTGAAVSSVSGVADATIEVEVPATSDGGFFARVGEILVNAASAVKGYAISAWNWVTGLFSRNTTTEVIVDAQPEAVPAAA